MGIIIRTAGSNKTKNEIDNDLKKFNKQYGNSIKEKSYEFYSTIINSSRKVIL